MNDGALTVTANADCPQPLVCPLSHVRAGTSVRIKQLSAPPDVKHRLREMGFCEEQKVRLLAQQANVICQVCNVRLGISAQLAEKILVEPIQSKRAA
jgi:Fe2+ transport system protein FeoA